MSFCTAKNSRLYYIDCRYGGCIQQFCGSSKQTDFGNKFYVVYMLFDHALFDVSFGRRFMESVKNWSLLRRL